MNPVRVCLAEDNDIYLKGLQSLLKAHADIDVCGSARNGAELLEVAGASQPDVVMTDIEMPKMDGIEATRRLLLQQPHIKVVALTLHKSERLLVDMLEAGARGYLDKDSREEHLTDAISSVHKGYYYYCPGTMMRLSKLIARSKTALSSQAVHLNEQEKAILRLICEEYSSKQIAPKVHLSVNTVETYRLRIQEKLKVKGTAGMVVYALRNGLYG